MKLTVIVFLGLASLLCSFARGETPMTIASLKGNQLSKKSVVKEKLQILKPMALWDLLYSKQGFYVQENRTSHFSHLDYKDLLAEERSSFIGRNSDKDSTTFIGAMIPFMVLPEIGSEDNGNNDMFTSNGFSLFLFLKKSF